MLNVAILSPLPHLRILCRTIHQVLLRTSASSLLPRGGVVYCTIPTFTVSLFCVLQWDTTETSLQVLLIGVMGLQAAQPMTGSTL